MNDTQRGDPPQGPLDQPIQIREWALTDPTREGAWRRPDDEFRALTGRVYGHPAFLDGETVTTTLVREWWVSGPTTTDLRVFARTRTGTRYELHGPADTEYDAVFVHARERLIGKILERPDQWRRE